MALMMIYPGYAQYICMRILPLFLMLACSTRTELLIPALEERYQTAEQIILDTSNNLFDHPLIFSNNSLLGPPTYPTPSERDFLIKLLNIKDSTYLLEQLKERRTLEPTRFKDSRIQILKTSEIETEDFWNLIKTDSIEGLYSIELPIFDETKTKCYLRTGYLCGELCGGQEDYLFQLNEKTGSWEMTELLDGSVY